jgi:O-acetyl-ADP-ribose deacetylase (regulator of RNase III)
MERAAPLAVATVREYLKQDSSLRHVVFCCFSDGDLAVYQRLMPR